MMWKSKKRKLKSNDSEIPKLGDKQVKRKFLFIPKKIKNCWYWLEFCDFVYEWKTYYVRKPSLEWIDGEFTEKREGWRLVKIITKQR